MSVYLLRAREGKPPHYAEGFTTRAEAERVKATLETGSAGHVSAPGVSTWIEESATYPTELTPTGEQAVIPGCERNQSDAVTQLDLFG